MKMKQLFFLASLSILSLWLSNCKKPEENITYNFTVQKVVPESGAEGDTVKIIGKNFILESSAITVLFGELSAVVLSSSDSVIIAKVPTGASSGPIKVQIKSASATSSSTFKIYRQAGGISIEPTSGLVKTTITIILNKPIKQGDVLQAYLGDKLLDNIILVNQNTVKADIPLGAESGLIKVETSEAIFVGPFFEVTLPVYDKTIIKSSNPAPYTVFNSLVVPINIDLNFPVDKPIEYANYTQVFKPVCDYIKVYNQSSGAEMKGIIEWNEEKNKVSFFSQDVFQPSTTFRLEARFSWMMKKTKNDSEWIPVKKSDKEVKENIVVSFSTASYMLPDTIMAGNIRYSYPIDRQFCFLKSEYPTGYIILKANQPNIFNLQEEGKTWSLKARFISLNLDSIDVDAVYKQESLALEFPIPTTLQNEKIYSLTIVKIPTTGKEKILHRQFFRTSKYNTFIDKATAMFSLKGGWSWALFLGVHKIGTNTAREECFDKFEMESNPLKIYNETIRIATGLIQFEAILQDNPWYEESLYPMCYKIHQTSNVKIKWRNSEPLGMPPIYPIHLDGLIYGADDDKILTTEEISTNTPEITKDKFMGAISCDVDLIAYYDYQNIQQQLQNYNGKDIDPELKTKILSTPFLPIKYKTDYFIKMKYVLPGIKKVSSEKIINIFVP